MQGTPFCLLAGAQAGPEAENAFLLEYREDGVFLTLFLRTPPAGEDIRALTEHITRKKLVGADMGLLSGNLFLRSGKPMRLAPPQEERAYEEGYSLSVEDNQMSAYITLSPPEPGKARTLSAAQLRAEIESLYHVVFGVDEEAFAQLMEERPYGQKTRIAQGRAPVPGKDGALIFHFEQRRKREEYRLRVNTEEGGRVDFKDLDLFEPVQADQLLVTKVMPEPGVDGSTVFGNPIVAEAGKLYNLPLGRNTYVSEDKLHLHAALTGRVYMERDKVEVSNIFTVEGNAGLSTGNIDFDGDVVVYGNVESGYTIKATGNIEVMGTIEAAELYAGADVVAYSGIQGAGKGSLHAQGSVYARFMEYTSVFAETMVVAESVLNCEISCHGFVEVLNGRGNIIGGKVAAVNYIAARSIGNTSAVKTFLEVGVSPAMREREKELEARIDSLDKLFAKLQQMLAAPPSPQQSEHMKKQRMDAVRQLLVAKEQRKQAGAELERHRQILEKAGSGQVHALVMAYQGCRILIGESRYNVNEDISYVTFREANDEVSFTSCRFRKKPEKMPKMRR